VCYRRSLPIQRVGLYIPGGSAPLFSTLLMLGTPARLAGCEEIVLCTPPQRDGSIFPAILFAASLLGIRRVVRAGGAQAIAALAYGTESVLAVDKIFGPGNQYVTAAKQMVAREGVAIDLPAGPSELAILADRSARADFVAADLLSQAEHGPDSQVVLVSPHEELIEAVREETYRQLRFLPRREAAAQALAHSKALLVESLAEGMEFLNLYAPEHLILAVQDDEFWASKVRNAGSVFLGHYSPESAGDYASGTNHTLPTNGHARAQGGVSLDSFVKKITYQRISPEGLRRLAPTVSAMAEAEGLSGHRRAVSIRLGHAPEQE
jgi:histidinol dehydrogenase